MTRLKTVKLNNVALSLALVYLNLGRQCVIRWDLKSEKSKPIPSGLG